MPIYKVLVKNANCINYYIPPVGVLTYTVLYKKLGTSDHLISLQKAKPDKRIKPAEEGEKQKTELQEMGRAGGDGPTGRHSSRIGDDKDNQVVDLVT